MGALEDKVDRDEVAVPIQALQRRIARLELVRVNALLCVSEYRRTLIKLGKAGPVSLDVLVETLRAFTFHLTSALLSDIELKK